MPSLDLEFVRRQFPAFAEPSLDGWAFFENAGGSYPCQQVVDRLHDRLPNQGHFFNADIARKKLIPAGPDHAQIAAAAGIADYFDALYLQQFGEAASPAEQGRAVRKLFRDHEIELLTPLIGWLDDRDDVRLLGPATTIHRAPTLSLQPRRKSPAEVLATLRKHQIMAGGGHFYAVRPLQAMQVPVEPGVVRLSFLHYTSSEEIERLIVALAAALD